MNKKYLLVLIFALCTITTFAQESLPKIELTEAWKQEIKNLAPDKPTAKPKAKRKILIFSLFTGFDHWVVPHTAEMIKILGDKSQAYSYLETKDISFFSKEKLREFDAVVLNNTCSIGDNRNIFYDVYLKDPSLTEEQRRSKAANMENNLFEYVSNGGGLIVLHGGVVMQNKTPEFGKMVGGSFDYHPKQQPIDVKLVDKKHPLVAAFKGEGFTHIDEPYFFNNAYFDYNFRPLLYMETDKIKFTKSIPEDKIKYIAWIKRYGKGRVFYASPSHNAQSMNQPALLKFFLDSFQYTLGDLKCDDSPIGK